MMCKCKYLLAFLLTCIHLNLFAQQLVLEQHVRDQNKVSLSKIYLVYSDSVQLVQSLQSKYLQLLKEGYLSTGMDLSWKTKDTAVVLYSLGSKVQNIKFVVHATDSSSQFPELNSNHHPIDVQKVEYEILSYIKRNSEVGYPFSVIRTNTRMLSNDSLQMEIFIDKGKKVNFSRLYQKPKELLREKYLNYELDFHYQSVFDQSKLSQMEKKIRRLPYLDLDHSPRLLFFGSQAQVWLYLKKKPSNKLNVLLGLAKINSQSTQKYKLAGEAEVDLWNSLKLGEEIYLKYENLDPATSQFYSFFDFPYIQILPIGVAYYFKMIKNQENFLSLEHDGRVQHKFTGDLLLGMNYKFLQSFIIQADSSSIIQSGRLPDQLDFVQRLGGFFAKQNLLDDIRYPGEGWKWNFGLQLGRKNYTLPLALNKYLEENVQLMQELDSLQQNKWNIVADISGEYFHPLYKIFVSRSAIKVKYHYSAQNLRSNELYREGGFNSIRGFNQGELWLQNYAWLSQEIRFKLDRKSFLQWFVDYMFAQTPLHSSLISRNYFGTGIGMQFGTMVGDFTFQFAWGKSGSQPLQWDAIKVHFGYSNFF
jgi:hypothetical protein